MDTSKHIIRGIVTKIHPSLPYFEIEGNIRIYFSFQHCPSEYPCHNSEVEIWKAKIFNGNRKIVIMGPETKYKFFQSKKRGNRYSQLLKVLRESNVDNEDILAMDDIVEQLVSSFDQNLLSKCFTGIIQNAPCTSNSHLGITLYKKSLRKCKIKVTSDINYVNKHSGLYTFINFDGMCSYNIYPNQNIRNVTDSCVEYLIGILDVDLFTGYFTLSDKISKIFIKIYMNNENIYNFKNTLVLLKKWTVITEVFQETNVQSFQYLLINVEDIVVLENVIDKNEKILFYPKEILWEPAEKKTFYFQLLKISEIIYGYNHKPECWIEALISNNNDFRESTRLIYLTLTDNHISIVSFLKENYIYKVFCDELKRVRIEKYKELYRLRNIKEIYQLDEYSIFQECNGTPNLENNKLLESFEEVNQYLKNTNEHTLFNFCLTISKKELQCNNSFVPWISQRHDNMFYGTPGENKQMRLTFWNPETNTYIDLYMNDRDNHITPLGLIEGMKIRIKHVQVCKRKYIKTTVFSTFEIVEYSPKISFSSVNLFFKDRTSWQWQQTPKTLLGMFPFLPLNCIVHGSFIFQAVRYLKITPVCKLCKETTASSTPCKRCNVTDRDLDIVMSICAADVINPSFFIETDNKHFFFEIFELRNAIEIGRFCNAFFKISLLEVNFCSEGNYPYYTQDPSSKHFIDLLVNTIRTAINFRLFCLVDSVCSKQRDVDSKGWKLIEFDNFMNSKISQKFESYIFT